MEINTVSLNVLRANSQFDIHIISDDTSVDDYLQNIVRNRPGIDFRIFKTNRLNFEYDAKIESVMIVNNAVVMFEDDCIIVDSTYKSDSTLPIISNGNIVVFMKKCGGIIAIDDCGIKRMISSGHFPLAFDENCPVNIRVGDFISQIINNPILKHFSVCSDNPGVMAFGRSTNQMPPYSDVNWRLKQVFDLSQSYMHQLSLMIGNPMPLPNDAGRPYFTPFSSGNMTTPPPSKHLLSAMNQFRYPDDTRRRFIQLISQCPVWKYPEE